MGTAAYPTQHRRAATPYRTGVVTPVIPPTRTPRRTLVTGAIWVAPVVVASVAAPAFALSQCMTGTVVGTIPSNSYDQITVTNNGPVKIPAGTQITWVVQNVRTTAATLALVSTSGVNLTSGTNPVSITSNGTTTWTFTTTADVPVGGTVWWRYSITGFTYNSKVAVDTCFTGCVSDRVTLIGTVCPTGAGAAAVAPLAKASYTLPDGSKRTP